MVEYGAKCPPVYTSNKRDGCGTWLIELLFPESNGQRLDRYVRGILEITSSKPLYGLPHTREHGGKGMEGIVSKAAFKTAPTEYQRYSRDTAEDVQSASEHIADTGR